MTELLQVYPGDSIAHYAYYLALQNSNGKIKSSIFDFWKEGWKEKIEKFDGGIPIVLCAYLDVTLVGTSAVFLPDKNSKTRHSFTVVHRDYRRQGIGSLLLSEKLRILSLYPKCEYSSFVSKTNEAGLHLCSKFMKLTGEGTRERENKEPTHYYVFSVHR